jgi:hypothetical protein
MLLEVVDRINEDSYCMLKDVKLIEELIFMQLKN